jgi:hypothetical protein
LKKIDWTFIRLVLLCYATLIMLACYPVSEFATVPIVKGIAVGVGMSLVNIVLGYAFIEASFGKSHTTFLTYVLGGMVVRLLLMWGALIIFLCEFSFHTASLMITLLLFYVVNLVLEILYLQKRVEIKR